MSRMRPTSSNRGRGGSQVDDVLLDGRQVDADAELLAVVDGRAVVVHAERVEGLAPGPVIASPEMAASVAVKVVAVERPTDRRPAILLPVRDDPDIA